MKHVILLFILSMAFTTNVDAQKKKKKNKERDQVETVVEGLGCPFCAYGLEKKFKKVKGIKNIEIDIEEGLFSFTVPVDTKMTLEEVDTRVVDAGYTPMQVKITRFSGEIEETKFEVQDIATDKSAEFVVWGICDMCKSRIERTVQKVPGVGFAKWDKKTKILKIDFDAQQTNVEAVKNALASAGHDTEDVKASEEKYDNLPACCLYDRNDIKKGTH